MIGFLPLAKIAIIDEIDVWDELFEFTISRSIPNSLEIASAPSMLEIIYGFVVLMTEATITHSSGLNPSGCCVSAKTWEAPKLVISEVTTAAAVNIRRVAVPNLLVFFIALSCWNFGLDFNVARLRKTCERRRQTIQELRAAQNG